eukprot:gene345-939_t
MAKSRTWELAGLVGSLSFVGMGVYKNFAKYDHGSTEASFLTDWSAPPPWPIFTKLNEVQQFFANTAKAMTPPPIQMMDLTMGFAISQTVYVAARLGIADLVVERPKTVKELAKETGADEERLRRLLNACVGFGVFNVLSGYEKSDEFHYVNSKLSATLRKDHPHSHRDFSLCQMMDSYDAWGFAYEAVHSKDAIVFEEYSRQAQELKDSGHQGPYSMWNFWGLHPEQEQTFQGAMTSLDSLGAVAMVEDCPNFGYSNITRIVDIGTSQGHFLLRILSKFPHLKGLGMDLPRVINILEGNIHKLPQASQEAASRATWHPGSFFNLKDFPKFEDGDQLVMRYILHDWTDAQTIEILQNIRKAIGNKKVTLLIGESDIKDDPSPDGMPVRALIDLHMLMLNGGVDRSPSMWAKIFAQSGWKTTNHYPTRSLVGWTEATPV